MRASSRLFSTLTILITVFAVFSCQSNSSELEKRITALEEQLQQVEADFKPGLHTLMSQIMVRHARLWFAGDAQNWDLANHEIHELEEDLELTMELHDEYKDYKIAELIQAMLMPSVEAVEEAIKKKNKAEFIRQFDLLTTSCNNCHLVSGKPYIVMQRPTTPPYSNLKVK